MQSVFMTDDQMPDILAITEDGNAQFFDYPGGYAFGVGDQIVLMTELGPSVYRVVDVESEVNYVALPGIGWENDIRRVTVQAA